MSGFADLADYRRRVADLYAAVRAAPEPSEAWQDWRAARDDLFRSHQQSPLEPSRRIAGYQTPFFGYDTAYRVSSPLVPIGGLDVDIAHSGAGTTTFFPIGTIEAALPHGQVSLVVFWLAGYGGGLFLPFRDGTSGQATYGGGRYLLDGVKSADLGMIDSELVLDFNFAYHPSCVYNSRWSCPLAPSDNHLGIPIEAGERLTSALSRGKSAS